MKGLLIKDYLLVKNQKMFLIVVIVVGVFMLGSGVDVTFISSYVTFLMTNMALSTISYDEYENSAPYLFALPITRAGYVMEKYVFALLNCVGSWLVSMLIIMVYMMIKTPSADVEMFWFNGWLSMCCALVFAALAIPMWIKLGPEKGRLTFFVMAAGISLVVFLSSKLWQGNGTEETLISVSDILAKERLKIGIGAGFLALLGIGISYLISVKIVKNKQL